MLWRLCDKTASVTQLPTSVAHSETLRVVCPNQLRYLFAKTIWRMSENASAG